MATFFQNKGVQVWGDEPVYGTLYGNVSRTGDVVTLSNMQLVLSTYSRVSGTKHYTFSVNDTSNSINISVNNTTNLGTYNLAPTAISVSPVQSQARIEWRSTEYIYGYFYINFPAPPIVMGTPVDERGESYLAVRFGVSSFGTPDHGTVKLLGGITDPPTTELAHSVARGYHKFVYSGLTPNTTYYFKATATNGQMTAESATKQTSTLHVTRFYGGVNGKAKRINKLYVGVNGVAKPAEFYGSLSGEAKRVL